MPSVNDRPYFTRTTSRYSPRGGYQRVAEVTVSGDHMIRKEGAELQYVRTAGRYQLNRVY